MMSLAGCVRLAMVAMDERAAAAAAVPKLLTCGDDGESALRRTPKLVRILSHLTQVRETAQSWTG